MLTHLFPLMFSTLWSSPYVFYGFHLCFPRHLFFDRPEPGRQNLQTRAAPELCQRHVQMSGSPEALEKMGSAVGRKAVGNQENWGEIPINWGVHGRYSWFIVAKVVLIQVTNKSNYSQVGQEDISIVHWDYKQTQNQGGNKSVTLQWMDNLTLADRGWKMSGNHKTWFIFRVYVNLQEGKNCLTWLHEKQHVFLQHRKPVFDNDVVWYT